jgi:cytochrome b pre-mRNA-processing protein 3
MLRFLFPRLTPDPRRGEAVFAAATGEARQPHWYVEGGMSDTLDGRFRVLATVLALITVRLERDGDAGEAASVALTERFIEVMESEHRELGLGDPKLGRTVRKLVGSLARRVELWRSAVAGTQDWDLAAAQSLAADGDAAAAHGPAARSLEALWARLEERPLEAIMEGRLA